MLISTFLKYEKKIHKRCVKVFFQVSELQMSQILVGFMPKQSDLESTCVVQRPF